MIFIKLLHWLIAGSKQKLPIAMVVCFEKHLVKYIISKVKVDMF